MVLNAALCTAAALACAGVSVYSNSFLGVTEYALSFSNLPKEFDGFRILQVSDLHNKRFGKNQEYLLKALSSVNPDIIAVTGDIIHDRKSMKATEKRLCKVRPFLRGALKIAPVYYATGNHEIESGFPKYIWKEIKNCGAAVLINESTHLERGGKHIALIGAADPFVYGERKMYAPLKDDIKKLCEAEDCFKIVLAHRPEALDIYADCGADLVLTGHAHGGQIRIPFTSQGLFAPDQGILPKYTQGVHACGKTQMVISRGLGNSGFPQRLFNRPELVLVTLKKKA